MDLSSAVGRNLLRIRMSHSTVRHGVLRRAWLILVYTQELYALPSRLQHCCLLDLNRRFLPGQGKLVPAGESNHQNHCKHVSYSFHVRTNLTKPLETPNRGTRRVHGTEDIEESTSGRHHQANRVRLKAAFTATSANRDCPVQGRRRIVCQVYLDMYRRSVL
jgi:hypothetical protein